jgi:O-antigen/teichoic acid export membrane protein
MTALRTDKRLRTDFTWVLSGNVLYSACQWGIVVVLAKLGSAVQVGEYALGLAVSAPIVLFANLQLRALLASDVNNQFAFGQYLTFRMATLGAALIAVAGLAAFTQPNGHLAGVVMLVGLAQALEFVSDTYYGLMQRLERMDRISVSLLLKGPLSLAALWAGMYLTRSVVWAVVGLLVGRLLVVLMWDSRLRYAKAQEHPIAIGLEWNSDKMLTLLRMALPLGVISMLVALNTSIPRYFVEGRLGSAELGIFSALASLLSAGSLVVAAFGQSIFLPVARACAALDRAKFRSYVALAAVLGGALGGVAVLASVLFGRDLLTHLFRPEYGGRADILVRLMIAGTVMFIASGLGYVLTAARSLGPQIPLLLATALAAAGISAWSIPRHGLSGAADAVLVSAFVQLAGTGVLVLRVDRQLQRDAQVMTASHERASVGMRSLKAETT